MNATVDLVVARARELVAEYLEGEPDAARLLSAFDSPAMLDLDHVGRMTKGGFDRQAYTRTLKTITELLAGTCRNPGRAANIVLKEPLFIGVPSGSIVRDVFDRLPPMDMDVTPREWRTARL